MSKDLFEEELDLGLLDESDDDNMEVEKADNTSQLRGKEMEQSRDSGDPKLSKQRLRLVSTLFPRTPRLNNPLYPAG